MRILVIGGSNSLMGAGYLDRAAQILERNLGSLSITNLSVGGTSSFTGLARVFDLPPNAAFDAVLYEYALNDSLIFQKRANGRESVFLAIQLLVAVLAERFPDAAFLPVSFAARPNFAVGVACPIHELTEALWQQTGAAHLDVRAKLSYVFAKDSPDWLYSDALHYSAPHGVDIVGSLVARHVLETMGASSRQTLAELDARIKARPEAQPTGVRCLSAQDLAEQATGDWSLEPRENGVMSLTALRLRPGAEITFTERPLNLAVLADRRHGFVRLARGDGDGQQVWKLSTRSTAAADPRYNPPDKDRFFYSGLPMPLILQTDPLFRRDFMTYRLTVDPDGLEDLQSLGFFNFGMDEDLRIPDQTLDLVSALFLTPAQIA